MSESGDVTRDEGEAPALSIRAALPAGEGCVDYLAYCGRMGGWLACGWLALHWEDSDTPPNCTLDFGSAVMTGDALLSLFQRDDVKSFGTGFVLFQPSDARHTKLTMKELWIRNKAQAFLLAPSAQIIRLAESEAIERSKAELAHAPRTERRARLLTLLSRSYYDGHDTVDSLAMPVFIETDVALLCPPGALLLRGWFADPFRQVSAIRLRCGARTARLDPRKWVQVARPDVLNSLAQTHSGVSEHCGFMVFVADICVPGEPCYYELETASGDIVFKRLPPYRSPGLEAIKETLSVFDLRRDEMVAAYDQVVGPAVAALNRFRLAVRPRARDLVFGTQPENPACSLVIPLYGRIDFMEYQLAAFSRTLMPGCEVIYVLDDPPRLRAVETLAASCLARFALPFRVLALDSNSGYAPANNIGLVQARAPFVCFLNSDILPKTPDWLDLMLQTAHASESVGAVGARLLYEDGSLQHDGCIYEALPEFGGWHFAMHPNKGFAANDPAARALAPGGPDQVQQVEAVTGACLLMRTALARAAGGFDEGYVIGDFEDIDLCRKLRASGLVCVIDRRAELYHLERQSQGGQASAWRLNLTLYNAWRFQNRWIRQRSPGAVPA